MRSRHADRSRWAYRARGYRQRLRTSSSTNPNAVVHHGIRVPGAINGHVEAEPIDVEYRTTPSRCSARRAWSCHSCPEQAISGCPGTGWCSTTVNDAGTRMLSRCLQPGERPPRASQLALQRAPSGQRNPESVDVCAGLLAVPGTRLAGRCQWIRRIASRSTIPHGSIRYPVGGPQLAEAHVVVTDFPARGALRQRRSCDPCCASSGLGAAGALVGRRALPPGAALRNLGPCSPCTGH